MPSSRLRALRWSCILILPWSSACQEQEILNISPALADYATGETPDAPAPEAFRPIPADGVLPVEFGPCEVGVVTRRYLFLESAGGADVEVMPGRLAEGSSPAFLFACQHEGGFLEGCARPDEAPVRIPPGELLVWEILFIPSAPGDALGGIHFLVNEVDRQRLTVEARGRGAEARLQLCTKSCAGSETDPACQAADELCLDASPETSPVVALGERALDAPAWRRLTLRNPGELPLEVTGLELEPGSALAFSFDPPLPELPARLEGGASVDVHIHYRPEAGRDHAGTLLVLSQDPDQPRARLGLTGRGLAPRLCADPLALDFGHLPFGASRWQSFRAANCGTQALQLSEVRLAAGSSAAFELVSPPAAGQPVPPGESVAISVLYRPTGSGQHLGEVELLTDDPGSDPVTGLSGTIDLLGRSDHGLCELAALPVAVDFGWVAVQAEAQAEVRIANVGAHPCTVTGLELLQAEFSVLDAPFLPLALEPGDTLRLGVAYRPENAGADFASLVLSVPETLLGWLGVQLEGAGTDQEFCDLRLSTSALDFGLVNLFSTQTLHLQIDNRGLGTCELIGLELRDIPAVPNEFTVQPGVELPFAFQPNGQSGSRLELALTFTPTTSAFVQMAMLQIQTDLSEPLEPACPLSQSPGQMCVELLGVSALSSIEVLPAELGFGVVTVGCASRERCLTIYNLGTEPASLDGHQLDDPSGTFELSNPPGLPAEIAPRGSQRLCARFGPLAEELTQAELRLSVAGEERVVALRGHGVLAAEQVDLRFIPERPQADVLFVIDCSESMADDQQSLAQNFESFIQWAAFTDTDFHLGVIGAAVLEVPGQTGTPPREVLPGVLVEVPGRPKILTPETPDLAAAFADLVRLGDGCSPIEAGLEAAWLALKEPRLSDPSLNAGFLRADAGLYLVIVSDEPDQSSGPVDFYLDTFRALKGGRGPMRVSAICADTPPDGRYAEAVTDSAGVLAPITALDWSQTLQELGLQSFSPIREIPLSRPAQPGSLVVSLDGLIVPEATSPDGPDGFSYRPDSATVYFGDQVIPSPGMGVEIRYLATCE